MQRKEGRGDEGTRGRGEAASEVGSEGASLGGSCEGVRDLGREEGTEHGQLLVNGARAATRTLTGSGRCHCLTLQVKRRRLRAADSEQE